MNDLPLSFIKMHGLGNDFVIIDGRKQNVVFSTERIALISDRHFGIGCDQLIILQEPENDHHDVLMLIYNQDGSQAETCGNATRCVARIIIEEKSTQECLIETLGGLLQCWQEDACIFVNMGKCSFERDNIGLSKDCPQTIITDILPELPPIQAVSMGNPHAVIMCGDGIDIEHIDLEKKGRIIENHPYFLRKTNVEFVQQIKDMPEHFRVRVWERGAGATLACGSGACASYVVVRQHFPYIKNAIMHMNGGDLLLSHNESDHIIMGGETTKCFTGIWLR